MLVGQVDRLNSENVVPVESGTGNKPTREKQLQNSSFSTGSSEQRTGKLSECVRTF